jgi:transposase
LSHRAEEPVSRTGDVAPGLQGASPTEIVGKVLGRHAVEAAQPFFEPAVVGVDVVDMHVWRGGVRLARRGDHTERNGASARERADGPAAVARDLIVCCDRPFGGRGPPAALFYASRDRTAENPERHLEHWSGILQADAYSGYNRLYQPERKPGRILEALCWSHARRKFFELADIAANARRGKNAPPISPMALEAVKRIDLIFDAERDINGLSANERLRVRREVVVPLVAALESWLRTERAKLSRHAAIAKAIDYMLVRWSGFTRFLEDGRICLTNNAAERALRGLALGRESWLFAGSQRGAERAAFMYTLIQTAKLNDIDPQAWLADVLTRIADMPLSRLGELLPWKWRPAASLQTAA